MATAQLCQVSSALETYFEAPVCTLYEFVENEPERRTLLQNYEIAEGANCLQDAHPPSASPCGLWETTAQNYQEDVPAQLAQTYMPLQLFSSA
jgi:hypothetical protein